METYNGWTNRATWLVNLHLTNDPDLAGASRDVARHAYLIAADDYVSADDTETAELIGEAICEAGQEDTFAAAYAILSTSDATDVDGIATIHQRATWNARNALEDYVKELVLMEGNGLEDLLRNDLLGTVLADVDWAEVADAMMEV